jgi:hypothetical protein
MDQVLADVAVRASKAPVHPQARGLLGWLYTSNPFYVISADLVFIGLRLSLDTSGKTFATWALMVSLFGYILLLASTACLLIRYGRVWDDARTILLLVVAMFLALSVTFDETLAQRPGAGLVCYLGGLAFAVVVSEGLLRGIGLRLPALFRLAYYVILGLFFLYPVALIPLLRDPESPALRWALFGFAPTAGLAFLLLLPAIRRGPAYVAKNGSPWRYPLYPWTLFGLLAAAVCGRAYYLCISLHFVGKSNTIFGAYFLVPFLFVLTVLLLEAGLTSGRRLVLGLTLLMPVLLASLAMTGVRPDPEYHRFSRLFAATLGATPFYLTLLASAAFYVYAAGRRVPYALGGLSFTLLALVLVGPRTSNVYELTSPRAAPLLAIAAIQLALAIPERKSWRALLCSAALVAALAVKQGWADLEGFHGPLLFHLAIALALLIGAVFDDPLARWLRRASAAALGGACLFVLCGAPGISGAVPREYLLAYPLIVAVTALIYGYLLDERSYYLVSALGVAGFLTISSWQGYLALRRWIVGLDWIVWGLASFAVAALISVTKTGAPARWRERHTNRADSHAA